MAKYFIRRVLQAIPVLIGISLITYFILLISPGGPYARFAQNPRITSAQIEAFAARWGLNDPIPLQYCKWLGVCGEKPFLINALPGGTFELAGLKIDLPGGDNGMLHGDLGYSISDGRPVADVIGQRILPTLILAGTAYAIWLLIAFLAGVYAAVKRYSLFDSTLTIVNYIGYSLPTFWLGIMLITLFSVKLGWLPTSGRGSLAQLVMPSVTLSTYVMALLARLTRSNMLEVLREPYVRTARAKGLREALVVHKHALKSAALPIVTVLGLQIGALLSGAVVTETVFNWPGIGTLALRAIQQRDYPVLQGVVLVSAVLFVVINGIVDLLYRFLDPRVRLA